MMNEIHPIIIELLRKRGVFEQNEVLEFLSDKPKKTYDPFLLLNLEAGVDLILSAARQGKKICVYGDYDADGITSISLMTQILSHLTDKLDYYVPCRFVEGYGLNKGAIEIIKKRGADMIITVDCGSVSMEEAAYAEELGMDIVITDHHSVADAIADCLVINPKQPGCGYPFQHLAGVGVAFKLAQGIQKKADLPKSALNRLLDLVAVGTIGDIVPLVDENRTLVKYGLQELNRMNRKGMKHLVEAVCQKKVPITSEHITYTIVPHLNAAGRMDNAGVAVELLAGQDEGEIVAAVDKLVESNRTRKQVQEDTYQHCARMVDAELKDKLFLLLCLPDAHEGVAGIVAGKIKDKYQKPTIIVTRSGDLCKGTGRSTEKINLYELLSHFGGLFSKFGGHAGACGFLTRREDLPRLAEGLEERMARIVASDPAVLENTRHIDFTLRGEEITADFGETLQCLAPFGNQNKRPLFLVENVQIKNPAFMGEAGNHARFTALCESGAGFPCVLFNRAEDCKDALRADNFVNLSGCVETQYWNGSKRVQFFIEDFI